MRRRDGKLHFWGDNDEKIIWGPYKFEFRQEILRRLLRAQKEVQAEDDDLGFPLITMAELEEIRRLWRTELGDWEDRVCRIWREETGTDYRWLEDDTPIGSGEDMKVIDAVAAEHGVPSALLRELIEIERQTMGFHRRSAVYSKLDSALKKDWRSDEEMRDELSRRQGVEAMPVDDAEGDCDVEA
jgi:DNA sulfur modification protein DndC